MLHAVLCLLPVAALAVPLLLRRYPGAARLVALSSRERIAPRRSDAVPGSPGRLALVAVRGGLLIARSLAVRPPPASLPAAS